MIYHRKTYSSINLNTGAKKEKENTEKEEKQVLCPPEELACMLIMCLQIIWTDRPSPSPDILLPFSPFKIPVTFLINGD